jgi:hypothetical protein
MTIEDKIWNRINELEEDKKPLLDEYTSLNATKEFLSCEYSQKLDELEFDIQIRDSGIDELKRVLQWMKEESLN